MIPTLLAFFLFLHGALFVSPVRAGPIQEDIYFQDVTSQAWREYDQKNKSRLNLGRVAIENPEEARYFFKQGLRYQNKNQWKKGVQSYRRALSFSPEYPISAEILWQLGHCYEKLSQWVNAFEAYGLLFRRYPGYDFSEEALFKQFQVAQILAEGKERVVLSMATDRLYVELAEEMFMALQKQAPKSQIAGNCQYELGKIYKKKRDYHAASAAFYTVLLNYPNHGLAKDALYESGICASREVRGAAYDAQLIKIAEERLSRFIETYPEDPRRQVAKLVRQKMEEFKAQKLFLTATYYQKTGNVTAAEIYFQRLLTEYPNSHWAERAQETKAN